MVHAILEVREADPEPGRASRGRSGGRGVSGHSERAAIFSVEGFFRKDGSQRFRAANGFPSEAAARQWVYDQLAEDGAEGRQDPAADP